MQRDAIKLADRRGVVRPLRRSSVSKSAGTAASGRSVMPNAVIGTLVFVGAEAMFFAGLISAFLVLRAGSEVWPPTDQPRLPVLVTAINTLILLASGYTMQRAVRTARTGQQRGSIQWLGATLLLGVVFLAVQGSEWLRLLSYGLHASSSLYGATFYALIGAHGLHVFGAVIVLMVVRRGLVNRREAAHNSAAVEASRIYWFFVVGVWPILYVLVYLL